MLTRLLRTVSKCPLPSLDLPLLLHTPISSFVSVSPPLTPTELLHLPPSACSPLFYSRSSYPISYTILHRDADHHRGVDQNGDYAVLTISNPISNQIGSDFGNIL